MKAKGTLIPIGGNEDKGGGRNELYTLEFITDGILSRVVKESGGVNANIVVITTASGSPLEVGANYLLAFEKLGCKNVEVLDIRSKADTQKEKYINFVKSANCVMFSGGDQSKITNHVGGTVIHQILTDRYKNEEGFVIAGTSAGAMAMCTEMIAGGSSTEAFMKGAVSMYTGLGLTEKLLIDTHFILRGRFGRVAEAVAKYPHLIGIGLSEDTGLVIKNGNEIKVIGSGMAIVFDGSKLIHNNERFLDEGIPMTMTNLIVHVLSNSDQYFIAEREVHVLPMEAPFE